MFITKERKRDIKAAEKLNLQKTKNVKGKVNAPAKKAVPVSSSESESESSESEEKVVIKSAKKVVKALAKEQPKKAAKTVVTKKTTKK